MTVACTHTETEYYCDGTCLRLAKIAKLEAENEKLHRMLCDLTPGGSEFVNNPENCVAWVKRRSTARTQILVERIKQLREEQAARQQAQHALRLLCHWVRWDGHHNWLDRWPTCNEVEEAIKIALGKGN